MAGFTNAEKFANIHLPYGVADVVATAIDDSTADATAGKPQIVALVSLTDSTTGTPGNTVSAIPAATAASTDTTASSLTSVNASLAALRNDLASLTAKVNAVISALKA